MINLDNQLSNSLKKIKYIDLFAGIGGFHLALSSFGAKCVFASEIDKHAKKNYEFNFNMEVQGDINKIDEKLIPHHDILCAGFPCQAFSISGKQLGLKDKRGILFYEIIRIVKYHTPKILILENVQNFEKHDNGKTLKILLENLNSLNYKVFYKVLNSSNFGLPQNRKRIYIICFRKDLSVNEFNFPQELNLNIFLKNILVSNSEASKYEINREDISINNKKLELKNLLKPIRIGQVNKGGQGERIYSIHGHSITLSAYGGGIGAKTGLYFVNNKIRKLTPRECARLQGFPENFKIDTSNAQAYKQFGNSISINVVQFIIKEIINQNILGGLNMDKAALGSRTAKGGFKNEIDICNKFNDWKTDLDAQKWIKIMGYNLESIEQLTAIQVPTKISINDISKYNCSPENYNELTKFKKADAQIKLIIKIGGIIKIENISIKRSKSTANFNQIDKRPVSTYKNMWNFDDEIEFWLKLFTGEILVNSIPKDIKIDKASLKKSNRIYINEMPQNIQNKIINFFDQNKILIISDILKGRGGLSANWILVTRVDTETETSSWKLVEINQAMNFYGQGKTAISPRGSLKIGKITMQRKGGTPDPTSLQFKFNPCDLFNISNN